MTDSLESTASCIALLGRKERPTDGVEDYCNYLADALARRGVKMKVARVNWAERGWLSALRVLRRESTDWRGAWVVLHYTALAWSRRGFPLGILFALAVIRRSGARCAVLLHERARQLAGTRLRDRVRGRVQVWVIRRLYRAAEKVIFTVPLQNVPWLEQNHSKAVYIPIGANIPERPQDSKTGKCQKSASKTVAVFCLSLSSQRLVEIADLVRAAERVRESIGDVRFVVLGKGSDEARPEIEAALSGKGVEVSILGRLPADEVADTLAAADVLLYLCGHVTQTRGSALAGVACGLPIVGYAFGTREPIHDAGVELVSYRDREALAAALVGVLTDAQLRIELRRRSNAMKQTHFSWESIGDTYIDEFGLEVVAKQHRDHVREQMSSCAWPHR